MTNVLVVMFIIAGLFFFLVGTIGVIRFPDALTRAHGAAKCDTLGAVLCLSGLMLYSGFTFTSVKLLLVIVFLWSTNPVGTHLLAKAIVKASGTKGHDMPPSAAELLDAADKTTR